MPKNVKFVSDYRGVLTGEVFYRAGEVVALSDEIADQVIAHGRATAVRGRPPAEAEERQPEPSILDNAPTKAKVTRKRAPRKRPSKTRKP